MTQAELRNIRGHAKGVTCQRGQGQYKSGIHRGQTRMALT